MGSLQYWFVIADLVHLCAFSSRVVEGSLIWRWKKCNGFSPVCVRMCCLRVISWANAWLHWSQLYVFSPVWLRMCRLKSCTWTIITLTTNLWFSSSVFAHVPIQITYICSRIVALITLERPLEARSIFTGKVTLFATERLFTWMSKCFLRSPALVQE